MPVPERLTVCGEPEALSVMLTLPVRAPAAVGVKVTLMEHAANAVPVLPGSPVPQLFVSAKSPLAAMLVMLNAPFPGLESVTDWAALVVLTC